MNLSQKQIEAIQKGLEAISENDLEILYDEMLDEVHGEIKIGTLSYFASKVLSEVDPTAYRCGFADWLDYECQDDRFVEIEGLYYTYDLVEDFIVENNLEESEQDD